MNAVRIAAVVAVASLSLASVAASANPDPSAAAKAPATAAVAKSALSKKALRMVWCVAPKGDVTAKKECKTRGQWIEEGRDPFAR